VCVCVLKLWRFGNLWTIGHHRQTLINRRDDWGFLLLFCCLNALSPIPQRELLLANHVRLVAIVDGHTHRLAAHLDSLMTMMKIHVIPIGWYDKRKTYIFQLLCHDDSWWCSMLVGCCCWIYTVQVAATAVVWLLILRRSSQMVYLWLYKSRAYGKRERNKTPRLIYIVPNIMGGRCYMRYFTFYSIHPFFTCCWWNPSTYFMLGNKAREREREMFLNTQSWLFYWPYFAYWFRLLGSWVRKIKCFRLNADAGAKGIDIILWRILL
jgi:hypothetical protein